MIVVITLNYNQNEYTLKCIESLLANNYFEFTVLLIDNGSHIESYTELKNKIPNDHRLNLVRLDKNIGYVGGINYGLSEGLKLHPNYFLIMNNDTVIDKNAISELVKTSKRYFDKAIVTGKVYHYDDPMTLQDVGCTYLDKRKLEFEWLGLNEKDKGQYDFVSERDMIDDVFWIFSVELYEKIGGYSTYFWFNAEQADFALRANKNGFKLVFTPFAKLWHKGSISIGGRDRNPKQAYWTTQSKLILRYLHLNKFHFTLFYFLSLKGIIGTYFKTIVKLLNKEKVNFDYPNAKTYGLFYFNNWFFRRNKNSGKNPFS